MTEDMVNFRFEKKPGSIIKVIGVGGGGGNAVNHMYHLGIRDVDFIICNTDSQALSNSPIPVKVHLGSSLTEGRGAGNKPEIGRQAATENIDDVTKVLQQNTKMVFITAGMGGGTGTGGAPVIASVCRDLGYLTVGIVTIPFRNEGKRRIKQAIDGIQEMEQYVDSLLVINNERIREMFGDFPISEAFARADDVLATAAKGIAEIITVPGYVNVDFADVETVM
ncbi:MAG TPA: cell division protein FtsZ, partial [Prolixibacteraceae bacterium]|nr:cell division protein FtsZ [Prolixibacteraceae bacterium]